MHGGMALVLNVAILIEIDKPQPTSKTYLAYIVGYIVFLYLIGNKLCPCKHNRRWFPLSMIM